MDSIETFLSSHTDNNKLEKHEVLNCGTCMYSVRTRSDHRIFCCVKTLCLHEIDSTASCEDAETRRNV